MGKRELAAFLNLSSWCFVMVERLFLAVPRGCLRFVMWYFLIILTYYFWLRNKKTTKRLIRKLFISKTPPTDWDYKNNEYDQEIPQLQNCRQNHRTARKGNTIITRHQEDKLSKATSCFSPIKMISKLEWTKSNTQQNIRTITNPKMGVTINNIRTTALERTKKWPQQ